MKVFISLLVVLLGIKMANAECIDHQLEIKTNELCTKIMTYSSAGLSEQPVLLVALHGDSPFNNPGYQYVFAKKVAEQSTNLIAVGLLRPGYTDPSNRTSDGERGKAVGDNYGLHPVKQIAATISYLKESYKPRKVILAGHSGGSAITANLIALYPGLVDHAVLVSCPCNVKRWREDMFALTGENIFNETLRVLSPTDLVDKIAKSTKIAMFVGKQDVVTKPYLSKEYQSVVSRAGIAITLTEIEGEHDIFLNRQVISAVSEIVLGINEAPLAY